MKPTTQQLNFYIHTRCQLGKNASKIHKELTEVWGHDNICSKRHVYRTVNEFRRAVGKVVPEGLVPAVADHQRVMEILQKSKI